MKSNQENILLETRIFDVFLLDDGIVNFKVRPNITVDLKDAKDYIQASIALEKILGGPYPVITTISGMVILTKEAKNYIREYASMSFYTANAIVVDKSFLRAMMRLIMTLIPSNGFPEEVFHNENAGIAWLIKQRHSKDSNEIFQNTDTLKTKVMDEFRRARKAICSHAQVTPS